MRLSRKLQETMRLNPRCATDSKLATPTKIDREESMDTTCRRDAASKGRARQYSRSVCRRCSERLQHSRSCGNGLLLSLLVLYSEASQLCKISGSRCLSEVSGKGSEVPSLLVSRNVAKLISVFAKLQHL